MSQDGYTLVEMLAALAIIGLSMTAAMGAVQAVGRLQHQASTKTARTEVAAALNGELDHLLAGAGPFSSAGGAPMLGEASGFSFRCGKADCRVRIAQTAKGARLEVLDHGVVRRIKLSDPTAGFRYLGSRTMGDHWPPDNPTDWQRLRAIALVTGKDAGPIALTRIWLEGVSPGTAQP